MTTGTRAPRDPQAGLTLVEMLVALALFALIGSAGITVLDQVLRSEARTAQALDALADLQRAAHLLATDTAEADPGSLAFPADGGGTVAVLSRRVTDGRRALRYAVEDGAFVRHVTDPGAGTTTRQVLLPGTKAVAWEWIDATGQWHPATAWTPERSGTTPRAVAVTLRLGPGDRSLRLVLPLIPGAPV
jgi:general secretion pathway protein J